jgi:hypothetical protein
MAPAPSKAPALATEGDARNTNHNVVELGLIGSIEIAARLEDSEGARRELVRRAHAYGAERIVGGIEARKVNGAA